MNPRRRRSQVPIILLAMLAAIGPVALLLWVSHSRTISRAEDSLRLMVDISSRRAERILRIAEQTLDRLAEETGGGSDGGGVSDATVEILRRAVYGRTYFREAGLISPEGYLVCTSLGPVEPPIVVDPREKSDPAIPGVQIVGVVKTAVMGEESIIVSRPTTGNGEVNVLIDPDQFIDLLADVDLGPDGSIAFLRRDGAVLAARGRTTPIEGTEAAADNALRLQRDSERFSLIVVGRLSRLWALRDWISDLKVFLPVGLLCSGILTYAILRLARRPRGLEEELRIALANGEFEAHYQPTIETATRKCVGAEVLIRWNHPEQGYIRPDVFIAVAEESRLIEPITEALMRRVAAEMADIMRRNPDLHLGINLAPEQFASQRIVSEFPRIFNAETIPPRQILLEATERSIIDDEEGLPHKVMAALREQGATIALDDFGTGYSSLSYLHKFKFDYLKIDTSFIRRIGRDTVSSGLLNAIIDLGKALGVKLIAEGVENELQFKYLQMHDVQYVQGWLFSKALPAREFRDFLARQNA